MKKNQNKNKLLIINCKINKNQYKIDYCKDKEVKKKKKFDSNNIIYILERLFKRHQL